MRAKLLTLGLVVIVDPMSIVAGLVLVQQKKGEKAAAGEELYVQAEELESTVDPLVAMVAGKQVSSNFRMPNGHTLAPPTPSGNRAFARIATTSHKVKTFR